MFLDEFNRCQESARNALMPALDSTRRMFHPIENRFLPITDNVQFIAAVNRGSEFSGTFAIDAAQLDRFAPLQMDYPPPEEEVKLLQPRHPELSKKIDRVWWWSIADRIRKAPELSSGLSVRATDEVCTYLKHPLIARQRTAMLPEVLKSSFCGRFYGKLERRVVRCRGGLGDHRGGAAREEAGRGLIRPGSRGGQRSGFSNALPHSGPTICR